MRKILLIGLVMMLIGCDDSTTSPYAGKTLKSMTITKIEVNGFPPTQADGSAWDELGGAPDPFVEVSYNSTIIYTSDSKSDVLTQAILTYTQDLPKDILYPSGKYTIHLWDSDVLVNDDMGGYDFTPWDGQTYPASQRLKTNSQTLDVTVYYTYNFQ